jgi:hypothetical protein
MKRVLIICAVAFTLFLIAGVLLAGRDETPLSRDSSVRFGQGHAEGRRLTTRSWSCDYDKMTANNDQTIMDVDGVHDGIIYREGKPYLRLRAQHFSVNTMTHDFSANGKLHVETVDRTHPRAFESDSLAWNEGAQTLTVNTPLTFYSESDEPLRVNNLIYDVHAGTLHLGMSEGAIKL